MAANSDTSKGNEATKNSNTTQHIATDASQKTSSVNASAPANKKAASNKASRDKRKREQTFTSNKRKKSSVSNATSPGDEGITVAAAGEASDQAAAPGAAPASQIALGVDELPIECLRVAKAAFRKKCDDEKKGKRQGARRTKAEQFKISSSQKWKWVERYVAARNKTTGRIDYKELSTKTEFIVFKGYHEELEKHEESLLRGLKLAYEEDCARNRFERECKDLTCFSPGALVELVLDGVRGQSEETRELMRNLYQEDAELKAAALQLAATRSQFSLSSSQAQDAKAQVQDTTAQMSVDGIENGDLTEDYEELKSRLNQAIAVHKEKTAQKMKTMKMWHDKKLQEVNEQMEELKKKKAERDENIYADLMKKLRKTQQELQSEKENSNSLNLALEDKDEELKVVKTRLAPESVESSNEMLLREVRKQKLSLINQ